jgi:manganese transport protein
VFSQVILSLQLGFAVIPLIHFTSDKQKMGAFVIKPWIKTLAWLIAVVIVGLNVKLVMQEIAKWMVAAGDQSWIVWITAVPLCIGAGLLLLYITFKPLIHQYSEKAHKIPHGTAAILNDIGKPVYSRIAVCIDFSAMDVIAIRSALAQGGHDAQYVLVHVVETAGAMVYGSDIADRESGEDKAALQNYADQLKARDFNVDIMVGFGNPKRRIPEMTKTFNAELLVMGAHGHNFIKDLVFGTTVNSVRHRVDIPVFIVREETGPKQR